MTDPTEPLHHLIVPGRSSADFAYGVRLLRKSPAFTATCIAIVALGIGATTAMFSIVYGVALRPLPYREPERLVSLWARYPRLNLPRVQVNAADHRAWQAANDVFGEIALARQIANFNLTGNGEPERLFGARVSASLFRVLGVAPAVGRAFVDGENENGRDRVVLLSDGLWKRRFGGDPSIVGRAIMLSGVPYTVVGVMKPDFQYPGRDTQVWTPLTVDPDELTRKIPGNSYLAIARLQPAVTVAQAQSEMDGIARRLAAEFPKTNDQTGVEVVPLHEDTVGGVRRTLYVLLGAVTCLLLIACLNLASLLGARAASRAREFAVRLALGASRGRLARQALAEVTPIVTAGGVLGVVAARWAVAAFIPLAPSTLPRVDSIELSAPVLLFSIGTLAATGLVAGLLPAMQAWRSEALTATREETRSLAGGRAQARARRILVVTQIALVLPLLVAAGLLARSFSALVMVDPGFRAANIQTLQLAIPRSKYPKDADVARFCERLVERVAAIPGVASVGMVNRLPLAGVVQINLLEFDTADAVKATVSSDTRTVTPDYFRTIGIPLVEGRFFTEHDRGTVTTELRFGELPTSLIVDDRIARTLWPGESALGKRARFALPGAPWMEILGVVGHIRTDGLDVDPRPQVYFNYFQRAQDRMALLVRGDGDVVRLRPALLQAIREIDAEQPVYDVRTLTEVVDRSTAQRRLNVTLVTAFAAMALLLASIGVYGVIAYSVTKQVREFGVRIALGAGRADITRLVMQQGVVLTLAGAVIGLTAAFILTRAMQSLLFGVTTGDPASFAAATALLLAVALLAAYLPARRAAAVDPAITLRNE